LGLTLLSTTRHQSLLKK